MYCSRECAVRGIDWGARPQSLYNPNMHSNEKILCACGCGTEIPKYDKRGRPRKYASGHTMVGKKRNVTWGKKIAESRKRNGSLTGEKHWNWKGGISDEMKALRKTPKYDEWRFAVYKRDHYTCQYCKKHCASNDIIAHHLEDFRYHKELRYDVNNGVTLCRGCHLNVHRGVLSLSNNFMAYTI
jgi:Pyruvate/2-oxoacid:ferredoxin oxidoreductase delta subunit